MKRRIPTFGCMRIAQQISYASGLETDKDVVPRILANGYLRVFGKDNIRSIEEKEGEKRLRKDSRHTEQPEL